jgi:hypothetical protein
MNRCQHICRNSKVRCILKVGHKEPHRPRRHVVDRAVANERSKLWWRKKLGVPEATRPCPELCELCGQPSQYALVIDHDHKTGAFRGWICRRCNHGISLLGDCLEGILKAVDYLKRGVF